MTLSASDVSRLVHHYLLQKGFENTANNLISECADLKGLKPVKAPFKLPRLLGPSLLDLLNGYYDTKDFILEELESFDFAVYNEQDSLPTLTKTLLQALKQVSSNTSKCVLPECRDAFTNTEFVHSDEKLKVDASVSTDNFPSPVKVTKDAFTSTCDVTELVKSVCDIAVNTEPCVNTKRCEASVNTDPVNFSNEDSETAWSNPPSSEAIEEVDFSLVVDRLIRNREIQERIAENINRKTTEVFTPKKNAQDGGNDTLSHDISSVIKAIAEETATDPAFDTFLKDCLGLESSQGPTPVGTPLSVSSVQECEQPSPAPPAPELELSTQNPVHQEQLPTTNDDQPLPGNNQDVLAPTLALCTVPSSDLTPAQPLFNQFGSYVCLSDSSGHLTLVPSMMTAVQSLVIQPPLQVGQFPEDNIPQAATTIGVISEVPRTQQKNKKTRAKRQPKEPVTVAIAPRPPTEPIPFVITIPDLSEYGDPTPLPTQASDKSEQSGACAILEDTAVPPGAALKSKPKPLMKITNRLTKKSREQVLSQAKATFCASQAAISTTSQPSNVPDIGVSEPSSTIPSFPSDSCPAEVQDSSSQEPRRNSAIPPTLEALMRIAKEQAEILSPRLPTPLQTSTGIRPDSEVATTTPAAQSTAYITTPTSSSRRRNHVRQLNFGESPDLPIASSQPIVLSTTSQTVAKNNSTRSVRSDVPWDLGLRNALATTSEDQSVFATPKGKAKRVKRVSPVAQTPTKADSSIEKPISSVKRTLQEPCTQEEKQSEADKPSERVEDVIDLIANERLEDSLPEVTISQPETSPPSSFIALRSTSRNQEANSNEKAAASVLIEMANSNPAPISESREEQLSVAMPSLTHFTQTVPGPSAQKQSVLPVHATPQKDPVMCEGHSSMSFGAWDGEIPRTPQIRLDVTNSNSPFQVSLTKGFRFLPAAESPSLSVPLTPSIAGTNSNSSIETPYVGFNQFTSILNTPRVEALRQEFGDSPSRSLSTTMISPTQVVIGRSAPYFVPSGERAQGPIINTIATPEHVPESDKKPRRRRSSTEMEPLQLEESNDASDAATALMSQAAANVAAALQQPSTLPSSPNKSDRSLEGDLINECHRLESAPPTERGMTRQELIFSLFGEDSENGPPERHPKENATEVPAGSKPAKKRTGRPKKTVAEKQVDRKGSSTEGTGRIDAKKAIVSKSSMSRCARKRGRSINSSSEDEAGSIDQQRTVEVVAKEDNESIIRELLSLAKIKCVEDSSPPKKRKRSASPRHETQNLDAGSRTPPSKRLPPSSGNKCPPSDIKSPGSEANRDIASTSIEASFSQEEVDADVPGEQTAKKKNKALNKADKGKRKQLARAAAMTFCSPIPKIIRNTVIKTPATATPVRLFKSASPFGRLVASRASKRRTPVVGRRRAITSDLPAEGRELELSSIPEESPLDASVAMENNNQAICPQKQVPNVNEVTDANVLSINSGVAAQLPEKSRAFPSSSDSNVSVVNNQAANASEPILQTSISNQSTIVEDIRSPEKSEELCLIPHIIPVSPVTRSNSDISATIQPVNPPVDLPGPSRGRADAPSQADTSIELVDSSLITSMNSNQTSETSVPKKKSKKKHSDPKLQSYLLLSNVNGKPPKTSQPQPDPVPFQTVQNNLVTPDSSRIAPDSPTVTAQDLQTHRRSLLNKIRNALQLTDPNDFLYSQ